MKVRDVMKLSVITVHANATYEDVARILANRKISGMPVLDETGRMIGTVSEKDLFRIMYPFYRSYYVNPESYTDYEERENKINEIRTHPVHRFMTRDVLTINPDAPIMRAGALMLAHNINRLPVVEGKKLVGIISRTDIYRRILENHFEIH